MELAKKLGVTTIARAGGKHFLVYNGAETLVLDAKPPVKTNSPTCNLNKSNDKSSLREHSSREDLNT
jgi:hypothetical protein